MGRTVAAHLVAGALLTLGALVAVQAPAQARAPATPTPDRASESVPYYGGVTLSGSKELGTTIELELEDGRHASCDGRDDALENRWTCSLGRDVFWPRSELGQDILKVYSVDATSTRSPAAEVTLTFQDSRLKVTSPDVLPSGDVIELKGEADFDTRIEWMLESDSGLVFSDRPCTVTEGPGGPTFRCEYDSSVAGARSARALMMVPDGEYEANFTAYQGTGIIDQIPFLFTVRPAPPPPPGPSGPGPSSPPGPGDPSGPTPSAEPGKGVGGGTPPATPPSGPPPTSGPTSGPTDPPPNEPTPPVDPTPEPTAPETASPTIPPAGTEPTQTVAAAGPALPVRDNLPILILAVLVFTVMGVIGLPGLALGGRFAPGSTRTGGGTGPVGRWPAADLKAAGPLHRSGSHGLPALAAGEVGTADDAVGTDQRVAESWGDRSPTWRAPGHERLDAAARTWPPRLAPRWPLATRLAEDGTPARAILGSLSLLLPAAGLVFGVVGGLQADGPYAPSFALSAILLAIGLADALAGIAAVLGFTTVMVATGGLTAEGVGLQHGLRGLIGVAALWFVVPLIAGAARPFRRIRSAQQVYAWDRAADAVIAALLCGWAVQGLVGSLDDLVGRSQPLTAHADAFGLLTIALVVGRFGLEEVAAAGYPARLRAVHATVPPREPSLLVQLRGVCVRAAFLAFFAWAFLGSCWQLWAGVAVFTLPYALALVHQRIPDVRPVAITVPRGVSEVLVLVVVGALLAYWIDGSATKDSLQTLRNGFVVLAVPASAIGVLGVLGGEAPAQRWTWPRQLAGAVVVAVTVAVVLIWL